MRFTVGQAELQAVLNYLADRPFKETQGLIAALQKDVRQDPNSPPDEAPAPEAAATDAPAAEATPEAAQASA